MTKVFMLEKIKAVKTTVQKNRPDFIQVLLSDFNVLMNQFHSSGSVHCSSSTGKMVS